MMWGLAVAAAAGALGDNRLLVLAGLFLLQHVMRARPPLAARVALLLLAGLCAAHGALFVRAENARIDRVSLWVEARNATVPLTGVVVDFPQARLTGTSFALRCTIAAERVDLLIYSPDYSVSYGDSLTLGIRPSSGRAAEPDRGYLFGRGVAASLRATPGLRRVGQPTGSWLKRRLFGPAHAWVRTSLAAGLGNASALPLGLVAAERGYFGSRRRSHFKQLGIAHLIALSGFHLGLVAGALLLLARRLRCGRGLVLGVALILYVGIVGEVHSLQRALVMGLLVIGAARLQRPAMPLEALGAAALVMCVLRPTIVYSIGYQLSVTATAAVLVWVRAEQSRVRSGWRRGLYWGVSTVRLGTFVQVAVVPLLLIHFGEFSAVSPLATFVFVLPVTVLLAVAAAAPVASAVLPWAAHPILDFVAMLATGFDWLLAACAHLAPPLVSLQPPNPVAYYIGFWLVVMGSGSWMRRIVGACVIGVSFASFS